MNDDLDYHPDHPSRIAAWVRRSVARLRVRRHIRHVRRNRLRAENERRRLLDHERYVDGKP